MDGSQGIVGGSNRWHSDMAVMIASWFPLARHAIARGHIGVFGWSWTDYANAN